MCSAHCCFVPPYVLDQLGRSRDPEVRAVARASAILSHKTRVERTIRSLGGLVDLPKAIEAPKAKRSRRGAKAQAVPNLGGKRTVYDSGHTWVQRVPPPVRTEGGAAKADHDVNDAYDYAGTVRDFFADVLGRNSIDNNGMDLILNVHFGVSYQNAFWDGDEMTFGDGDGQIFTSFARSLDVVGHELAHGVTQFTCGLDYYSQSGALNESLSDVWGSVITQWQAKQDAGEADWLIGDEIMGPTLEGEALRSMKAPGTAYDNSLMGADPQPAHMSGYYSGPGDNQGVHINSGIPNRAFYLTAIDIGTDKAALIWYQGQQSLWPTSNFGDAAAVFAEAARVMVSTGQVPKGAVQTVRSAFREVGL